MGQMSVTSNSSVEQIEENSMNDYKCESVNLSHHKYSFIDEPECD